MKHTIRVTALLVLFFFLAQIIGLFVVNQYIDHKKTAQTQTIVYKDLPLGIERPEVKNQSTSFIWITIAIIIGTVFVLLLARFNKPVIWKVWFFFTVWITLSIAFASFINNDISYVKLLNERFIFLVGSAWFLSWFSFIDNFVAMMIALIISLFKLYRSNIIVQNLSELFIYGGLAAIFVPILNLFAAFMLLIVISVYDFIAVFKTKHMIELATFQSKSNIFAGLFIPYDRHAGKTMGKLKIKKEIKSSQKQMPAKIPDTQQRKKSVAVLGGGDIGFTLIFAGVVMKILMIQTTVLAGFLKTLIIPVCTALALLFLLLKGKQNKFYPAMPVLSLGCFVGYFIIWII